MPDSLLSVVPSLAILGLAALAAFALAVNRPASAGQAAGRRAAAALALATGIQGVHFAEELASGFHERFPALFGLPPMPLSFFVAFNLAWLGIWAASVPGLRSARPVAFFAAWFLAIAGLLNGIAHPLLSIATGAYFPGLITSPFIGAAGYRLWRRLSQATRPEG